MKERLKYSCPKCGRRTCEIGEIRTASTFFTKIFNIQNKLFTSVTCTNCKFTEFYSVPSKKLGDVLDFFAG